jgi:PTS system fructose-specific IIA component/PTS system nitrogen regulatory IIA component
VVPLADDLQFPRITLPDEAAMSVDSAVRFLVGWLAENRALRPNDVDLVVSAVLKRESLGSTGVGKGIALPHVCTDKVSRIVGVTAHSAVGVPWDSLDHLPVHWICLLLSPMDRRGDHLRALEQLSRMIRDGKLF